MWRGTSPRGCERDFATIVFAILNELCDRLRRRRLWHDHHIRVRANERHWRQIDDRVDRRGIEVAIRCKKIPTAEEGVSIGRRLRDRNCRDVAAGTGFVLGDDLLAPNFR